MKLKSCPECGNDDLGERWTKNRMLEQYCHGRTSFGDYGDEYCNWVGKPYTPPKRRITNTIKVGIDEFRGWQYIIYDKYGCVETHSATHNTQDQALKKIEEDLRPIAGFNNPADPRTAVLFNVPSSVNIKGKMYKFKNGKVVQK